MTLQTETAVIDLMDGRVMVRIMTPTSAQGGVVAGTFVQVIATTQAAAMEKATAALAKKEKGK